MGVIFPLVKDTDQQWCMAGKQIDLGVSKVRSEVKRKADTAAKDTPTSLLLSSLSAHGHSFELKL